MLVEIASDLVCPWCYIGKRNFDDALATLAAEGVTTGITVEFRAFQLDPTAPVGAPRPVREAYARRFGGEDQADKILERVTRAAADVGLTMSMDVALRANTARAHRLLKVVHAADPRLQSAVNESVMQAYFAEGRDIADPAVLVDCARRAGFSSPDLARRLADDDATDPATLAVEADREWCAARGISSVPTFVVDDSFDIPGAQDATTLARLLRRLVGAG